MAWRWARLGIGIVAALIFLWLAFRQVHWSAGWQILVNSEPVWVLVGLCVLASDYLLRIVRWWLMLRSMIGLPFRSSVGPFLASIALNNVLPFRAGDLMRMAGFRGQLRLPPTCVLGTLVVERLLDLAALLVFFFIGLLGVEPARVPSAFVHAGYAIAAGCLLGIMVALAASRALAGALQRLSEAAGVRGLAAAACLARWGSELFSSLSLMRAPRLLGALWLLSLGVWFLEGAVFASVARALALDVSGLNASWFAMALGTLGTLLPSTPGYIGTFDYFTVLGMLAHGVPQEAAAIFTLLVHLLLWLPLTVVGLVWLTILKGQETWAQATRGTLRVTP